MASQDTLSDGKPNAYNLIKQRDCLNDRPIISQTANQTASPTRPPVAAKPRRKPPAPSPKPCNPCPSPHTPSNQTSQSSSILNSSSPQIPKIKEHDHGKSEEQSDEKASSQVKTMPNAQCQNATPCDKISTNPFEEDTDIPPSTNPFDEDTDFSPSTNPFEDDTEVLSEQTQTEVSTSRKSSQPPPLPTSPPSKARLSRSLSGVKVNSSLKKDDLDSPDIQVSSNSAQSPPVTTSTPNFPQSSLSSSQPSSSSSLNVIPPKIAHPSVGKSPPTVRPKPTPSSPRSPASNNDVKNQHISPNPPPRDSKSHKLPKVPATSTCKSNSESSENQKSDDSIPLSTSSSDLPHKKDNCISHKGKALATPPPVPKKSPKNVPKPSSVSYKKHTSPPPRPLPPSSKLQSPHPPTSAQAIVKESLNSEIASLQSLKYHEGEDDLVPSATTVSHLSSAPLPLTSQFLDHDLSQTSAPPRPDPPESSDAPFKALGGNIESQNISGAHIKTEHAQPESKEPDKKKVPPPLPKNPPRGRPIRRSVSGPTSQPDTPPPPPPPRVPPLSPCLRSQSLQDKSLTIDNQAGDEEPLRSRIESEEGHNSSKTHLVAPVRRKRDFKTTNFTKDELETPQIVDKGVESDAKQLVNSSSTNSFSDETISKGNEQPTESVDKNVSETKGAPRPVPRKRLSRSSVEISKDHQEERCLVVASEIDSQPKEEQCIIVSEHEYSEVYRGDSPEKSSSVLENSSVLNLQQSNKPDTGADHSADNSRSLDQNLDDTADPIISNRSSNSNTDSTLSKDEPEATCDMLKEIEELLKNKLGVSDESSLISLSNDSIDQRISRKGSLGDFDLQDQTEGGGEEEPVRPPRPKRDASFNRENSGSLSNVNSPKTDRRRLSGSHVSSTDAKKSAPPKPKRTTLPRIGRSLSDVTSSKSVFDRYDSSEPASSPPDICKSTDDIKPELPPRNESLRKGGLYQSRQQAKSTAPTDIETPPPLPPRNKPRSSSMNESPSKKIAAPPKPFLSASASLKDADANKGESKVVSPKRRDLSNFTKGALPASASIPGVAGRSPAPRPARKAPPPPPSAKRNSTSGLGDQRPPMSAPVLRKQVIGDNKSPREAPPSNTPKTTVPSSTSRVKKSRSLFHKFSAKKSEEAQPPQESEKDAEYHEISDSSKKIEQTVSPKPHDNESTRVKKSPPPRLPPRPKLPVTSASTSPVVCHGDKDSDEKKPTLLTEEAASTALEGEKESPCTSTEINQSVREKRAHIALIQKVSQDIASGLNNSTSDTEIVVPSSDGNENEKEGMTQKDEIGEHAMGKTGDLNHSHSTENASDVELVNNEIDDIAIRHEHGRNKKNLIIDAISRDRRVSSVSTYSTASEQDDDEGGAAIEDESSHSDTDPEDAEAIYAERKAKKVFNIAKEIASSEKAFVDVLKLINLDFRFHISKETEKQGQPILPAETLNKILDFLPQLQNFNEDLLKDLEHRIEHWEDNPCLADIFVKKGPFLKLYSSYIRNFENSTAILDDASKKNQLFAAAVKGFEMSPKCGKLALKHFMLKPIQRIPQYKLLLQEYLKNLHPHSQDYKNTSIALNIVTEVADHANESMRHGDNVQKLLEIQRSLIGQFEVIQPGREFVKQGELQKVSRKVMQPRMFFLFSDVLLYTTPVTSGYKLNNILPLSGMKINNPKLDQYKNEFNIIGVQRSFTLCASSPEEKEDWLKALHRALDENVKRFNTFESHKGPQTSLIDKDFVLGAKAPLWVPDARVTMCMVCLNEFTITWRRHHCRSCGRIICHQCSNNKAPLRYLQYKPARVCNQCYDKLHSDMLKESQQNSDSRLWRKSSFRGDERSTPTSPTSPTSGTNKQDDGDKDSNDSSLGFNRLLSRFHRIRKSGDKRNFRPSVLKEVHANDEGSDMSGYLRTFKNKKWKKLWFVVKGNVLYTYKASEDMAAIESTPLLGYEVTRMNAWYEGAEPDLSFELSHQNTQPLVSKTSGDTMTSPRVMPDLEKTKQRLIFRTDSAAAVTKWLDVLRAASCT